MNGAEARRWSEAKDLDWKAIGFRCGLEIHQQLDTRKLFSRLPSQVIEPEDIAKRTVAVVERRLRPTGGESGEVDIAARAWVAPDTIRVRGDFPLNLKDYRIGGLSKMLGILKMHENIEVHLDLVFATAR